MNLLKYLILLVICSLSLTVFSQTSTNQVLECRVAGLNRPPLWILIIKKKNYILNSNKIVMLNPNNIEKFDILKDAAATSIYGYRAANGVIIVAIKEKESRREYKRLKPYLEKV